MSEHKKTRSSVAAPGQVEGGAGLAGSSVSSSKFTTSAESRQIQIADYLGYGQAAAVPLRHLKELVDMPGREVRRMIQAERLQGIPILSDNINGYYLAADAQERERFIKSMRARASEIVKTAEAVERGAIGGE